MVGYKHLKLTSDEICDKISEVIGFCEKLNPPKFNINIKYLFMGLNPSSSKKFIKVNYSSDDELILSVSRVLSNRKILDSIGVTDSRYFDKALGLIDFDNTAKMFWQHKNKFKIIKERFPINKSYLNILDEFVDGSNNDDYILFSDLLYIKNVSQLMINKALKFNNILSEVIELYEKQIEYYKPKFLIVINRLASDIIRKYYRLNMKTKVHFDSQRGLKIIFGRALTGSWPINNEEYSSLKNLISNNINP